MRTTVNAILIPIAFSNYVVTAKAGHKPSIDEKIGFSFIIPCIKLFF